MPSRGDRRRQRRVSGAVPPSSTRRIFGLGRTERFAIGFLVLGLVTVAIVGVAISMLGGSDGSDTVANTGTPTGTVTSGGSAADEAEIKALSARSIEVLPAGQWPSLYDDFTQGFRQRCTLSDFSKAGVDSANSLGTALQQLEFKNLKELSIKSETASATIVGGYQGRTDSDYDIEAAFAREDGRWKLTPAPGTSGCSAFNQLGR